MYLKELVSECQLPECQLPNVNSQMSTPKMSTSQNVNSHNVNSQNVNFPIFFLGFYQYLFVTKVQSDVQQHHIRRQHCRNSCALPPFWVSIKSKSMVLVVVFETYELTFWELTI